MLIFRHRIVADRAGVEPATLVFRRARLRSTRTLTASKLILGETQAKFPGALPACCFHSWRALVFAAMACRPGTGFDLERSIFTFTAQKIVPGENRPEDMTCSTIELPPREFGEGRTRTDNHARISEVTLISLPGKLEPAAGIAPAWSDLQGRHVARYV